jgi:hypothetical protein
MPVFKATAAQCQTGHSGNFAAPLPWICQSRALACVRVPSDEGDAVRRATLAKMNRKDIFREKLFSEWALTLWKTGCQAGF